MNVKLNDGYRITSDAHQYILQKYQGERERDGKIEESWKSLYFVPTFEMILNHYFDLRMRTSDAETWTEVLKVAEDVRAEVKSINQMLTHAERREGVV